MGKMQQPVTADDKRAVQSWMSDDLIRQLDEAADRFGWSRSQAIVRACEYWLEEFRRRHGDDRPTGFPVAPP